MIIDTGATAAKSGVRAARKSARQAVREGHARARDAVNASERRAASTVDLAEQIALGVVDELANRGRGYLKAGRDRVYATEGRLFPRRPASTVPITLLAALAGLLLSVVFLSARDRTSDPA